MNYNNELENKIFRIILIGTLALSVISIIGNILFGFPFLADIKWFVLIGIAGYLLLKKERAANNIYKIIYFAFIIFVLIPVGWINSGGNANNTIGYIFLTLIAVNYMFYKNTRNFFIISLISIFVLIQIIGRIYPSIIPVYSYDTQFMDRLIQIPLTLFASYVMIKKFADEYRNEKENLDIRIDKIREHMKKFGENNSINITLSFGITQIKNNDTKESVLQRTDNALYKAKENGKNTSFFI
ncbi:MAG: diguanylate cyclase [Thermotogae bacterium]|nr:diguanylate cyclase [Thermotogota bacterium]MCP5465666.1 diguanylate cyclase [Thermotogota bacterium]